MIDDPLAASPLGKQSQVSNGYSPALLYPIPRAAGRHSLMQEAQSLPFYGVDVWTLYELSWLDAGGKPHNAIGQLQVPCDSDFLIESKSLKLYLNSFNQSTFNSLDEVRETIERDLSAVLGASIELVLYEGANPQALAPTVMPGECIDYLSLNTDCYHPTTEVLQFGGDHLEEEQLYSDLFRSLCPVTGQPDWASVCVAYRGRSIDHTSLLKYLISYRDHAGFHEQCVEQIFIDIQKAYQPEFLTVYARYLRRGGIDINPYRSSLARMPIVRRLIRQ